MQKTVERKKMRVAFRSLDVIAVTMITGIARKSFFGSDSSSLQMSSMKRCVGAQRGVWGGCIGAPKGTWVMVGSDLNGTMGCEESNKS